MNAPLEDERSSPVRIIAAFSRPAVACAMQPTLRFIVVLPRRLQAGRRQQLIEVSGRFCLPRFLQERLALLTLR
jgi:hypothetical protein